ncbi:sperm-associated antigen 17-like [Battus philenor]|uniref:sperm-associated antigen 17-like n=1 Tax=Battus philenor TaxID=42288 RepID=UPI0035D0823D
MPPKKEKDRTGDDNYWRLSIEEAPLNEESWEIKVIVFETAGSEQEIMYLNRFEAYAKEEKRFVIKNICKSETMFMVNQLGTEKKVKDESLRVFEEGHSYLKDKKDIPPEILALIIKHLVLKMKDEYLSIQRQKLVVKEGMKQESLTMINPSEVKNAAHQTAPSPEPAESTQAKAKGKKGEGDANVPIKPDEGKKYSTLLRLRGEEWRDKVYVDDYPIDGPNLYLAITGFLEPFLLESLIKIGVPLTAIVQIKIDPTSTKISSGFFTGTKRGHSANELAAEKTSEFWETIQQLRLDKTSAPIYKDMAFIVFNPPYRSTETLSHNAENIYDELCFLMYDIQDLTRQHYHYLDNMDVMCLPTDDEGTSVMLDKYSDVLNEMPLECTTIFSVLDSVLQIVCAEPTVDTDDSNTSLLTALTLIQPSISNKSLDNLEKADNLINKVFDTLSKSDVKKKKFRVTCGEEYDNYKDPVIIGYGDYAKTATFHLDNVNLDPVIWSSLVNMPVCKLWEHQIPRTEELKARINFHMSALLSCFERKDLDDSLLNRLIHLLSLRKLYNNRSSLKNPNVPPVTITEFKKVYLKRSAFVEPLLKSSSLYWANSGTSPPSPTIIKSDSYSRESYESSDSEVQEVELLFECPDISELVSATEIFNNKPADHLIDDYDFYEDFSGVNALQVLLDAFSKFNCLNYKYCEVTDSYVMMFYNTHDNEGIYREEWRCHLPTPVCLQDFFDFILEEQLQWIQDEEKLYDESTALKTKLEWKESLDQVPRKTCIEDIDELESEFLMKGSLKYQERVPPDNEEQADQSDSIPKHTMSSITTESDAKSNQKKSSPRDKKKVKEVIPEINADDISINNVYPKTFSGYDLGDRRVEVFGKDSIYFSKDGTKVYSFYSIIIPMNQEYLVLNVAPGNDNNEFWMQKTLSDLPSTESGDSSESFRIISKNQVIIYLKKNPCQTPPAPANGSSLSQNKVNNKESLNKLKNNSSVTIPIVGPKFFHSFVITWPNGLIIESVHDDNSPAINHIKQFYLSPAKHSDEDMRCIGLNGEVVVFRNTGVIEVFRADGTFAKITKCEKRLKYEEVVEDYKSTSSSDKSKKGKGKTKSKEKLVKSGSKSSKNTLEQQEATTDFPEYELFIDEFEITDGNGSKQTWVNDQVVNIENLLTRTATDYCLGEIFSRRMDGTNQLLNKDGMLVVTFHDNTRIITTFCEEDQEIYPDIELDDYETDSRIAIASVKTIKSVNKRSRDSVHNNDSASSKTSIKAEEEEKHEPLRTDGYVSVQMTYTIEHANFATVVITKADGNIVVESPNKTKLTVDTANNYDFYLDKSTLAKFDGDRLDVNFTACHQCQSCTKCTVNMDSVKGSNNSEQIWMTMKDSLGKNIVVDSEGMINIVSEPSKHEVDENKEEKVLDKMSESCLILQGKCREMYDAKAMRFFIFHRDLTCSELVHRMLIDQYKNQCRWQPWCSINQYDSFGDHRSILSILTPMQLTLTEKWLMRSKYPEKPKQLKFKDLKKDTGKGFYHWMRPYDRFKPKPTVIEQIDLPRLPRAYVLRTLEEMWSTSKRNNLKGGKEIVKAVLKYRRLMQSESQTILDIPIKEPRNENEKQIDEVLQDIGKRIFEELRNEVADDIQSLARPTITSKKPISRPRILTAKAEDSNKLSVTCEDLKKAWEDKQSMYVKKVEQKARPSPNLERYWRRRAEEAKEEIFFKQLLREESIPPYFRNMLGGAVWWEVNHVADMAVTTSRIGACKCTRPSRLKVEESVAPEEMMENSAQYDQAWGGHYRRRGDTPGGRVAREEEDGDCRRRARRWSEPPSAAMGRWRPGPRANIAVGLAPRDADWRERRAARPRAAICVRSEWCECGIALAELIRRVPRRLVALAAGPVAKERTRDAIGPPRDQCAAGARPSHERDRSHPDSTSRALVKDRFVGPVCIVRRVCARPCACVSACASCPAA